MIRFKHERLKDMIDKLKKQLNTKGFSFKRIVTAGIFIAISLVFVLFGMQGRHTALGGGTGAAARVNSTYISGMDLQAETQRMEAMYGQLFGGQSGGDAQRQFLRSQAVENLIARELISQAAKDQGVIITNAEVRDFISKEIPEFQQGGQFQRDRYVGVLEANHLAPAEFEERVRKDKKGSRLRHTFEVLAEPLNIEIEKRRALADNKLNVSFVKLDEDKILDGIEVSKTDILSHLANADFAKKVESEFTQNKANYSSEESVHAAHILIKAKSGDVASEKAALEKIQALKKRAAKEDFGKLAAANSEDQGSKVSKGDLGFFGHGRMVPEFEKAAFSQALGQVGEPVKSAFGYHLIKVLERKPAVVGTLENSKEKIAKKLIAKERYEAATKALEEALQKGDLASVDSALKPLGAKWEDTGFFELGADMAPKLPSRTATQAAFEVSSAKPLLPRVIHDGATSYVIKFKEAKVESGKSTNVGDTQVADSGLARERASDMFGRWLETVKKASTIEKNPSVMRE